MSIRKSGGIASGIAALALTFAPAAASQTVWQGDERQSHRFLNGEELHVPCSKALDKNGRPTARLVNWVDKKAFHDGADGTVAFFLQDKLSRDRTINTIPVPLKRHQYQTFAARFDNAAGQPQEQAQVLREILESTHPEDFGSPNFAVPRGNKPKTNYFDDLRRDCGF